MAAFDGSHVSAAGRGIVNVGHTSGGFALPRRLDQRLDMRLHDAGNLLEYGHRYRIAELLVSLSICHMDTEVVAISHQPCEFTRREAAGIVLLPLAEQKCLSVLGIT